MIFGVRRVYPDQPRPQALTLWAIGLTRAHLQAFARSRDLRLGLGLEVAPPCRVAILAGVRGDDDVRIALTQLVQGNIAPLAALSSLRREQERVHRTDAAEPPARESHERAVNTPEHAKLPSEPNGGHQSVSRMYRRISNRVTKPSSRTFRADALSGSLIA